MFSFEELGGIIRLILIYRFNVAKMNLAHKENKDKESKKDLQTGLFFVLIIIVLSFIIYLGS